MTLSEIYRPIEQEIAAVEAELKSVADALKFGAVQHIAAEFFQRPGKFLRPALVLLSAKAAGSLRQSERLIQAALGLELIHNASLIHDDIIDGDDERRGVPTLNRTWGNKTALLVGDALYSHAFGRLTRVLPTDLLLNVVTMNADMCSAEIEQAQNGLDLTTGTYYRIIKGKTAAFMSVCCAVGAALTDAPAGTVDALRDFGMNLGMAYQLFDDTADGELPDVGLDGPKAGAGFLNKALESLKDLAETPARDSLQNFCGFLVESTSSVRSR